MTDKQTPTARPWRVDAFKNTRITSGCAEQNLIAITFKYLRNSEANTAHIVKAVNAYDDLMELVAAVKPMLKIASRYQAFDEYKTLETALANVKGKDA